MCTVEQATQGIVYDVFEDEEIAVQLDIRLNLAIVCHICALVVRQSGARKR